MFTKDQAFFLGITEKENKILNNLVDDPKNIFTLSKKTKIPRTTLYPIITKLYERGFLQCKSHGQRFVYQTVPPALLYKKLDELALAFKPKQAVEPKTNLSESLKDIANVKNKKLGGWFSALFK